MNLIRTLIGLLVSCFLFAGSTFAEVKDSAKYRCGDHGTVTVTITTIPMMAEVNVSIKRGIDSSGIVTGTPGESGGTTCEAAPAMTAGQGDDAVKCDIVGGDLRYENANGVMIVAGAPRTSVVGGMTGSIAVPVDDGNTLPQEGSGEIFNDFDWELIFGPVASGPGPDEAGEILPRALREMLSVMDMLYMMPDDSRLGLASYSYVN